MAEWRRAQTGGFLERGPISFLLLFSSSIFRFSFQRNKFAPATLVCWKVLAHPLRSFSVSTLSQDLDIKQLAVLSVSLEQPFLGKPPFWFFLRLFRRQGCHKFTS